MLPIAIDRNARLSMTLQIQLAIRERIQDGTLHAGVRLPSSRRLAEDLGVSRGVVVQAYEQLTAEGHLQAAQGSGTRVATHLPRLSGGATEPAGNPDVRYDLRVDAASSALFPSREWLRAYEHVGQSISGAGSRRHPLGAPELREELAAYLGRSRGVLASAAEVAVSVRRVERVRAGTGGSLRCVKNERGTVGMPCPRGPSVVGPGTPPSPEPGRGSGAGGTRTHGRRIMSPLL